MKKVLFLVLLAIGFQSQADDRVIYGEDNRKEIYEVSSVWKKRALSTVALVESKLISENSNGTLKLTLKHYGKSENLCSDEPFREQSMGAFCSGFLVSKNLVVTAGHCIFSITDCKKTNFIFGFGYTSPNEDLSVLKKNDVYSCVKLVAKKENSSDDYAVIELDRPVVGYEPLAVRREGVIEVNDALVVIGYPKGIPAKVSPGANVRAVKPSYFTTNLDTYKGNSGSAVFNENTGLVEGILVRGETDFTKVNGCYKSKVCTDTGCRGEDVTRIDRLLQYIPAD